VQDALVDVVRAAALLVRIMEQHQNDLREIQRAGESSLRQWFAKIANGIGGTLGTVLGSIVGSVTRMIFGN
jgi:hypothetical protein